MTFDEIKTIWEGIPECANCNLDNCPDEKWNYQGLCNNIQYLKNYGQQYYQKICDSFEPFLHNYKKESLSILSMGCGPCLEYIPLYENFANFTYYPVDCSIWPIRSTTRYKSFQIPLPDEKCINNLCSFEEGVEKLRAIANTPIICFFNSICDILHGNSPSDRQYKAESLVQALYDKKKFFIVVNYTRSSAWSDYCRREKGFQTHREREDEFLQFVLNATANNFNLDDRNINKEIRIIKGEMIV